MLKQYIYRNRNGKRQRVGVLVGTTVKNQIVLGYSLCCPEDTFDRDKGLAIALGRALSPKQIGCPPSIENDVWDFALRCIRYFKDARIFDENDDFNMIGE